MVQQARAESRFDRINFEVATAERLPFGAAEFDLVVSTMTFHHWADQRQGIREIARVMKPSARWLLADFVVIGLLRYLRRLLRMGRFRERRELDAMLAPAGLQVLATHAVPGLRGQVPVLVIGKSAPGVGTRPPTSRR
jgi:SAM-dependent methyltransferase